MNLTKEEYSEIYEGDIKNIGELGTQKITFNDCFYRIDIVLNGEFKQLTKSKEEIYLKAMSSAEGRYILEEKGVYLDFYQCGSIGEVENKALDIETFNDGFSLFMKDLSEDEIKIVESVVQDDLSIRDYEIINLWT